ncbi:regulatory protein TetR [Enterobacter hormaechei]|uniref:TetR/AcrR family transcriptional regulator n=2 Tax=Bacteria TaxID=2 RepID=A0AAW7ZP90_ENTAS|nr:MULTISPECIES: TetR/AcrR family transcriptional regulator [Enterobacteriaceae]HBR7661003.1 TetR/AcrR family transcriptional regulator [Klebsiella pneumoniae]HCP9984584.1 TetR/AcrR family transcriptional regulator [Escherichia coli]HCT8710963.1 TetR/AcrR family transcriptional regulator [Raoultella ornithinolytica]AVL16928.1 TetR family transcriptional regulator [Enterobacter cloacae]AZL63566.1 TetR/AcrR family transcriptional regulator [Enterobacter asburiae]
MDKKELLISTAFKLFYQYGVHAVGINQVLTESGVAKKTLYTYFSSKEELIAATIDYCNQQYFASLNSRLSQVEDGYPSISELFNTLDDSINSRDITSSSFHGCYFINVSAEFSDPTHLIHQRCARNKIEMDVLIRHHVSKVISSEKFVFEISESVSMLFEGAIIRAHILRDLQAAVKARTAVEQIIKSKLS